ncbi:MAG: hypothetical protein ACLFUJ_16910, partial [Phycisphaerae bacterium]
MNPHRLTSLSVLLSLLVLASAGAETKKLPVTRDIGICAHPAEVSYSPGGRSRARIKHIQHYYLFDFDAEQVRNWQIESATLHVRQALGRMKRAAVCTVPVDWVEGTNRNMSKADGASCFSHRVFPNQAWGRHGEDILQATFNNPRMLWRGSRVQAAGDGWLKIPLDPKLVRAVAMGLSEGLLLGEDAGQTMANHDIFTREQGNAAPWIEITGRAGPAPDTKVPPRPAPRAGPLAYRADFSTGAIQVDPTWKDRDDWAHRIELLRDGKQVRRVVSFGDHVVEIDGLDPGRYELRISSYVDDALAHSAGPIEVQTSRPQTKPAATDLPQAQPLEPVKLVRPSWQVKWMDVTDLLSPTAGDEKLQPPTRAVSTARNAWASMGLAVWPGRNDASKLRLDVETLVCRDEPTAKLTEIRTFRLWPVGKANSWISDPAVPLARGETFALPWAKAGVKGQANQSLLIDVWVPAEARPGIYSGQVQLLSGNAIIARGRLRIEVAQTVLSDEFHIVGDMNTYSSPTIQRRARADTRQFLQAERDYYRLAHSHRMTLNVLPYNQAGEIHRRSSAPAVAGAGAQRRITDFAAWDNRYGPLLSGEAFAPETGYVGPGASHPIDHIYLPFHENWPLPLGDSFKPWPPPKDYRAFLEWSRDLPPIDQSLGQGFQAGWKSVLQQFGQHLADKGWTQTRYQVYLNNKQMFRDPAKGRGISLWLLDEPMFAIDFEALAFFGRLTQQAEENIPDAVKLDYRVDISRPQFQRDWFDGLVDLNVSPNKISQEPRFTAWRRERFSERYWDYAMPPSFAQSNAGWAAWPVYAYCWGAVGTLPWQTIANDGDYRQADATAMMYRGGWLDKRGPIASVRMKAWRQGLQDAELLRQL